MKFSPSTRQGYIQKVKEIGNSFGKRLAYMTPQEECLFGSTPDQGYPNPYMPRILQEKGIKKLKNVREIRKEIKFTVVLYGYFKLEYDDLNKNKDIRNILQHVLCSLEPLNENGETENDPQLVDENGKLLKGFEKSKDFSYRRNE